MMKSSHLLILLSVALIACSKQAAPPVVTERPVITVVIGTLSGSAGNFYSGEIRARHELVLGFRTGGKLLERLVDVGSQVKAGQVLARLDPADAGLSAGAAQSQYQLAEAEAKRYQELHRRGFVSASSLDAKETALKLAKAQAALNHNQSEYTTLRADHDGVITATLADVGQVVGAAQPVLRLAQSSELEVAIEIPEDQFSARHVGDMADIEVLSANSEPLSGRLRELSPAADPATRTYAARVSFKAKQVQSDLVPSGIALGMSARVRFNGSKGADSALLIPLTAIYQQGKQSAVWVVGADHVVSLRKVTVSAYKEEGAVIADGLKAGERIVSRGVHRLSAGEKIQLIEAVNGSAQ